MGPLRLKSVLATLGLTYDQLGAVLGISDSTVHRFIKWGRWPTRQSRDVTEEKISAFLKEHGATEEDVSAAFEFDDNPASSRSTRKSTARAHQVAAPITEVFQLPEKEMLSQVAKKHFQLFRDPFQDDVQGPDDVFLSEEYRYAREALYATARYNSNFLAIIGESGAGKSVLRRDLIDRIRREGLPVTCIMPRTVDKARLTTASICDAIIADISLEQPRASLEEKARQVERLLRDANRGGRRHVLIIEEAHDLSVATLKYLKRFWEIEDGFQRLLAIILIGQPELSLKLNEQVNWAAREVIRRCEIFKLKPLGDDLEAYLTHKMKRVGKSLDQIFDKDAFSAMRDRLVGRVRDRDGVVPMHYPLMVNIFAVRCMNEAAKVGYPKVNADVVKEV